MVRKYNNKSPLQKLACILNYFDIWDIAS